MRFVDDFATHDAAARFAVAQGIHWVNDLTRRATGHAGAPAPQICI